MFTSPRHNVFASSTGFSVEIHGFSAILYREAGRTLSIEAETLATPGSMALYSGSIERWAPPHDAEEISVDERQRVVSNIARAFAWAGLKLELG